jgi:hypothetical protein
METRIMISNGVHPNDEIIIKRKPIERIIAHMILENCETE